MKKPFDVLAEGLMSENSWADRTAIELFMAGVQLFGGPNLAQIT